MGFKFNPLTGLFDIAGSSSASATGTTYTPTAPADWIDPDPVNVGQALDDLAERTTDLESNKINNTEKGANNGVATLNSIGKIPNSQIPSIAITSVYVVANITARDALTVDEGDVAIVNDAGSGQPNSYIYDGSAWQELKKPADVVTSVNGQTGIVILDSGDIAEDTNLYFTNERAQDAVGSILSDTASIDFTYDDAGNAISAAVLPAGVDHNSLSNYSANRHIDHSAVLISAGSGLSGGGDITASRTISMPNVGTAGTYGSSSQTPVLTTDSQGRVTAVTNTGIDHNALTNYVANQHVDHTAVQIATAADSGLTGGGTIAATRNLSVDINGTTTETVIADNDSLLIYDLSATALRKISRSNFLSGYAIKSTGDINETSFLLANNQAAAADVTGFAFSNAVVRSFQALVSVAISATSSQFANYRIDAIQKGSSWEMSVEFVGDVISGLEFSITNTGQVQYTSGNYAGFTSGTVKFRAITTSV